MVFALAAPASAQVTIQFGGPQVSGFSNDYPWFNDVPQYQGDQSFRYFMAYHPDIAQSLSRNPGLLYNANWRAQFLALEQYLANHPYEWQALNGEYWSEGPAETQWGDYDNGQWRDAYWWHQNNPNWFYDNHANWASLDPQWLNDDGAYDQQNQWHYGEWWYNQDASWVTNNHPNWLSQHQNWTRPAEQQTYRQQHAMIQENQQERNIQPRPANAQQFNQQRANHQQQANLERQQTLHQENEQQQLNQQHAQQQQQASREQFQANQRENQQAQERNAQQQQRATEQRQASSSNRTCAKRISITNR